VEGRLTFSGGIHVEGHVKGELVPQGTDTGVVVGENGHIITAILQADTIVIRGRVEAESIRAKRLVLAPTAYVTGTLTGNVEIQAGARFEGHVSTKPVVAEVAPASISREGTASVARSRLDQAVGKVAENENT